AYNDHPVPIGEKQTISQPYIVALMTEALELKEKENTLERFHTGDGLLNNVVLGTLQDDDENIWIICFNGLSRIVETPEGVTFKNYSFSSGFPLLEINEGAFFKTAQGEFFIGGNNGYVIFNPSALHDNTFIPPVVITNLSVSNKKVSPLDETKILKETIYNTKKITLKYFQSIFTIDFAALNFIRPENNQYAYQLKGFDEDWVLVKDRKSVTYTSLPEGTYTFLVKGSNNDGVWNENPTVLEIVILPPPWKTWWAMVIYAFLILAGFWIIRYNAVKSYQLKSNLELEQLEKKKWKEIHDLKLKYFIDVSHEFRTPLTLILSPLEEILGRGTGDNWLKSRLKIMLFNAKRLLHLIDQILEIREIETGHHRLDLKPLYLKPLLEEVVDSFRALADKQKIKLNFELNVDCEIPLLIDQDKIEKVVYNLLSNAFKFTPSGGEISLLVSQNGHEFQFSVVDNGQGIGEGALSRVFDRFFKEGKGQNGAGIGLSLTHALVEIMGGRIHVESKLGKGTRFDVLLRLFQFEENYAEIESPKPFRKPVPLEFQDTAITNGLDTESEILEKETVLVAEDSLELRKFLKDQLKSKYDVVSAKNGMKALQKALKIGPSLVISDVMMPEMDGFELCKAIKSNPLLSHIPVILLTAKNAQQYKLEGFEYGADDYISKPFNVKELKAKVKSILFNRKLIQEKFRNKQLSNISPISVNGQDELLMKKLYELIIDNLDQPNLTVDFIGDQVGLSRVHLFRKIKGLTGLSPSELLKDYRMNHAMKMLSSGKYRVSDVAYAVGFQDVSYFGKVFKKHFGQSPTEVKIEERNETE
ncbi:response regulator, partial [Cecembia rubra]|uniref:hybrid sensor histidine kinase/response regulator transcription factor n=1 Tax=Cecembia rubra TaxID=1485585 RepID=UPI0027155855